MLFGAKYTANYRGIQPKVWLSQHKGSNCMQAKQSLQNHWFRLSIWLVALIALLFAWRAWHTIQDLLAYVFPHDTLEGTLLYEARLWRGGEQLYQALEPYRFIASPYPPVHPWFLRWFDTWEGPHIFWAGRLISWIAWCVISILVVITVRTASKSWPAGIIAAILLISSEPAILWASRIKPDMLALMWTTSGLCLATWLYSRPNKQAWWPWIFVSASFILALGSKQTAVAAPLAVGLALLSSDIVAWWQTPQRGPWWRIPRAATWTLSIAYAILLLLAWISLDIWSKGQFTYHVVTMHGNAFWLPSLMRKFVSLLQPYWPSMLLGIGLLWLARKQPSVQIIAWYLLVVPSTLFGAGKTGANHNHLLETLLALSLALGAILGWASQHKRLWPQLAILGCVALQLWLVRNPQEWYHNELKPIGTPERFVHFIRNTEGEMLSDDVGLLLMADKPLRYDDPTGMGPVALSGFWDDSGLIDDIRNHRFSAILLPLDLNKSNDYIDPARHWSPQVLAAIDQYYELKFSDSINIYVARQ
jgi:hypothetical protein